MPKHIRDAAFDSRVAELRGRGRTDQQIADELGCCRQTVRNARHRAPLAKYGEDITAKPARAKRAPAIAPPADLSPQEGEDVPLDISEQRLELSRLFRSYAKQARVLHDTNPAEANTAGRLASVFAAALSRVTVPEAPRDPNEHPDMVAAAERGRAKLWEYLERAARGA
jgi:hypothetical protein